MNTPANDKERALKFLGMFRAEEVGRFLGMLNMPKHAMANELDFTWCKYENYFNEPAYEFKDAGIKSLRSKAAKCLLDLKHSWRMNHVMENFPYRIIGEKEFHEAYVKLARAAKKFLDENETNGTGSVREKNEVQYDDQNHLLKYGSPTYKIRGKFQRVAMGQLFDKRARSKSGTRGERVQLDTFGSRIRFNREMTAQEFQKKLGDKKFNQSFRNLFKGMNVAMSQNKIPAKISIEGEGVLLTTDD